MSNCPTCGASMDCTEPFSLYSLESVSFPFVAVCPPGASCDLGDNFHLVCCHDDVFIQFPKGFSAEQKQVVVAGAVAECQRQATFCDTPQPPCQNPPCTIFLYWNTAQTCSAKCPDGNLFYSTIAAGTYLATSQIEADTFALRGACAKAKDHRICLSDLSGAYCVDVAESFEIKGTGNYLARFPQSDFWAIVSGTIPTGMTFNGGFRSDRKCVIDGTPTTGGTFTFKVRVTAGSFGVGFGDYMEKEYTLKIAEISPSTLPDAAVGVAYSQNLSVIPTHDQETETWTLVTSLPTGLTLTSAGVIHGTPTGLSESHNVTVKVDFTLDGKAVSCSKQYTLTVTSDPCSPERSGDLTVAGWDVAGYELYTSFGNLPPEPLPGTLTKIGAGTWRWTGATVGYPSFTAVVQYLCSAYVYNTGVGLFNIPAKSVVIWAHDSNAALTPPLFAVATFASGSGTATLVDVTSAVCYFPPSWAGAQITLA